MNNVLSYGILNQHGRRYLLDLIPNGIYAYSLSKVNKAYTGNAIEVYNHTTTATATIGYDGFNLDESTLSSFGGSDLVSVKTFYDQLGGPSFVQATPSLQPIIMSGGNIMKVNNKPALYFNATTYMATSSSISTISQPVTYILVFKVDKTASKAVTYVILDNSGTTRHNVIYPTNINQWRSYVYNTSVNYGDRNSSCNIAYAILDSTQTDVFVNNTQVLSGGTVGSANSGGTIYLGCSQSFGNRYLGYVSEIIAFNGDQVAYSDIAYKYNSIVYGGKTGLKAGLIACWGLNDTTGTTIVDSGDDERNCTSVNSPTLNQSGKITSSIEFNGSTQYLRYPNLAIGSSVLAPLRELSVSAWVYRLGDSVDITEVIASRYFASNGYRDWTVGIERSDKSLRWHYQDSALNHNILYYYPGSDIWTNNWVHVVCTRLGASMKIYINGVLEASNTLGTGLSNSADSSSNATFNIGNVASSSSMPDLYYYGRLEQVAVWNKQLSQDDVNRLYNIGNGRAFTEW